MNPKLIQWDYGKEINITLEDALMSLESLRFMLGGAIKRSPSAEKPVVVRHTEEVVCLAVEGQTYGKVPLPEDHLTGVKFSAITASADHPIRLINLTQGTRTQLNNGTFNGETAITFKNPALIDGTHEQVTAPGDHIRIFWDEVLTSNEGNETAVEVTISPSTYPGTYKVVGDTFMRSEKTGADEPFQFIINKAKVTSNVTLTLQAEGDPTTFEMTLNVLRAKNDDGEDEMMKLVRYNIGGSGSGTAGNDNGSIGSN